MENQGKINKIKSLYIIKNIFNYIKDNNHIQLKLFFYSKFYQSKFNIKLIDYKVKYLEKVKFNINKYLHADRTSYRKDFLNILYNNFLFENNLNKEEFVKIIYDVLENQKAKDINEINEDNEILIDLDSPLFEMISKTKNFENKYTIYICQENIDEYKLKNDFIRIFDKFNKLNIKYSSIFYSFKDKNKIDYLKQFKIDFNKIKRMTLFHEDLMQRKRNIFNENQKDKIFFEILVSFNNIENNLVYLKLKYFDNIYFGLDSNVFENINKLKSLRFLYIDSFNFYKKFLINLGNLKILSFTNCENINIAIISCQKLELLNFSSNKNINIDNLENANLKELKELTLFNNEISDIKVLQKVKFEKL